VLAGAADTILQRNRTDGILTGYEASLLNLHDTELVVLSACETGVGDYFEGEGIHGLQRAFLLAGTQSVLMSLWKINDQLTQQLMTDFYRYWLSGLSKPQALRKAQLNLRKQYPEPYYWGAFVLLGT
jgi:CHAT domain-containing protein